DTGHGGTGEHRPLAISNVESAEDFRSAIDLAPGGDASRAIMPNVRAVPAGPSVEHAVHLDDRLVERAIGRAEWNRQSDRDATSSRTRLEPVREEAGYSGGVGLEEDVQRPDLAGIRGERRGKAAAGRGSPCRAGGR